MSDPLSSNLLPCPFCGSTDLHDTGNYVTCLSCMADGPFVNGKPWNDRATLPPTVAHLQSVIAKALQHLECDVPEWYEGMQLLRAAVTKPDVCSRFDGELLPAGDPDTAGGRLPVETNECRCDSGALQPEDTCPLHGHL